MLEGSVPPISMNIGQAHALVDYVENPQNTVGVSLLSWAHYYQAKIHLLQSHLSMPEKLRYTHLSTQPRALTDAELERYISREIEYLYERLAYIKTKLQQLWDTARLTEQQVRIVREGLELSFTYRELTEMWERGI